MEPKQIIFLALLALATPALGLLVASMPHLRRWRLGLLVASIVWIVDVNLGFEPYRGTSSGFELGSVDAVAGGILISLLLERRSAPLALAPASGWPSLALGAWCLVTVVLAARAENALWELLRFVRAYGLFVLAHNLVRDVTDVRRYVSALLLFLLVQGIASVVQLAQGLYRVHGTYAHSNALGLVLITFTPLPLAVALQSPQRAARALAGLAFAAGALATVYTRSRASLGILAGGVVVVIAGTLARAVLRGRAGLVRRAATILLAGAAIAAPVAVKVADGVAARFREAPNSSAESRDRANAAARAILADHPLGYGLNNYVLALDRGYGPDIEEGDKTVVHNVYLLMAAESGWPGLALFLVVVATPIVLAAWTYLVARDDEVAGVALALATGHALCHVQQLYEWGLRQPQVLFQVAILGGVLARLWSLRHGAVMPGRRSGAGRRDSKGCAAQVGRGGPPSTSASGVPRLLVERHLRTKVSEP